MIVLLPLPAVDHVDCRTVGIPVEPSRGDVPVDHQPRVGRRRRDEGVQFHRSDLVLADDTASAALRGERDAHAAHGGERLHRSPIRRNDIAFVRGVAPSGGTAETVPLRIIHPRPAGTCVQLWRIGGVAAVDAAVQLDGRRIRRRGGVADGVVLAAAGSEDRGEHRERDAQGDAAHGGLDRLAHGGSPT